MVGEIVTVSVGKLGCKFQQQYWRNLLWEHGLDESGENYQQEVIENYHRRNCIGVLGERKNAIFDEMTDGYSPRAIFTDLSDDPMENLLSSDILAYDESTFVYSQTDAGRSYSQAWLESDEIFDDLTNVFRERIEACDRISLVQMVSGIGGGAGSGLASRILEEILRDEHGKVAVQALAVISDSEEQSLPQFYNEMFAIKKLNETTKQIVCLDIPMLSVAAKRTWGVSRSYHVNRVVANIMASMTGAYRFPSGNSLRLGQQLKYLCTSGNLKFHTVGLVALREDSDLKKQYLRDVRSSVFRSRDSVCIYEEGESFASVGIYRGGFGYSAYSRLINQPERAALSEIGGKCVGLDSTFVSVHNDTCIGAIIDNINHYANVGYHRKAHFHHFMIDGVVEADDFVDVLDMGVDIGHDYQVVEQTGNRPVKPAPATRVRKEEISSAIQPRLRRFDGLVVVLDIDETLMHCRGVEREEDDSELDDFDAFDWDFTMTNQLVRYFVSKRPGLDDFFDWVSTHEDIFLCVWTAAAKPYAECALIHALGSRVDRINLLWHRKQYREHNEKKNLKALAAHLGVNLEDMLMIDDKRQPFSSSWIRRGFVELIDPYKKPERMEDDEELERIRDVIEERLYGYS